MFGLVYMPRCIEIAAGSTVTFNGNFAFHPLAPGVMGDMTAGSPSNPITPTSSGTAQSFTFPLAGTYPYFCTAHASLGMSGVIRVR
jgi:plastocyanin